MMAFEKVSPEELWLAAINRRAEELMLKIADKRDAAKYRRRTADEIDRDADLLRDELNMLNEFRPQVSQRVGS